MTVCIAYNNWILYIKYLFDIIYLSNHYLKKKIIFKFILYQKIVMQLNK